jgi:hypothetical protein
MYRHVQDTEQAVLDPHHVTIHEGATLAQVGTDRWGPGIAGCDELSVDRGVHFEHHFNAQP